MAGFVESQCRGGEAKYRESTFEEYEGVLRNHVLPVFKSNRIDSIIKGEVRDFLVSKLDGLSVKRVMLLKCVLSNVFKLCHLMTS